MGKIHRLGITRKIAAAAEDVAGPSPAVRTPDLETKAVSDVGTTAASAEAPAPAPEPPPSPPEAPAAEPEAFEGHPVMQLKERSCRWPIGDPQRSDFRFCCAERLGSYPYCAEHAEISYMPQDRQSRRAPARNKAA
jgi:GcrA cell cycle regulator